ncbi:hypothetical protein L5515_014212 [Caenorhabditis briggsae]|uniref:Homeobox domain-containing protein n=1 Tax=Caenorhabditis briggsae TaxID=6238 RepID=A0AAE9EDN2_CAEBR|nr:hypothetical protein L3Y34_018092 [Caenorhabditis briggsae]UMM17867.1 hypothetical protein L5515_014212 [Caenorhabditis briggsae]
MVHSSAFHPYTRPIAVNPTTPEMSLSEENLRLILSAETLASMSMLPASSKIFQLIEPLPQSSPPQSAPALTPNPANSPSSSIIEHPLQSPVPTEKSRRKRTTFSPEQASRLETEYLGDSYMAREKRLLLAHSLSLSENQVKTWFQNRRAKDKRDRKTENSSNNTTQSRKSSPSRKSSSDSSPTPSLMTSSTAFLLPQIQTASLPTTAELLPSTPPAAVIQKIDQFPNLLQNLAPNLEFLNTYIQTLSNSNASIQSILNSSSPLVNPSLLVKLQSPLESAII